MFYVGSLLFGVSFELWLDGQAWMYRYRYFFCVNCLISLVMGSLQLCLFKREVFSFHRPGAWIVSLVILMVNEFERLRV